MPTPDTDKVSNYIREVAAEKILPRFRQLESHEIDTKTGPSDLVTVADIEAEQALTKILKDILPGSYVVGEEAVSQGTSDMSRLKDEEGAVWVIDPVDGTSNFVHGKPVFGTMVALCRKRETTHSWIFDIPGERMGAAEKGSGTYMDDRKIKLSGVTKNLSNMTGFVSTKFVPKSFRPEIQKRVEIFKEASALFCCAHEYLALAEGKRDFSFYSRIRPWDHLPGALIFAEAGGYSGKWDGSLYGPGDETGGLINAPDAETWKELKTVFLDGLI